MQSGPVLAAAYGQLEAVQVRSWLPFDCFISGMTGVKNPTAKVPTTITNCLPVARCHRGSLGSSSLKVGEFLLGSKFPVAFPRRSVQRRLLYRSFKTEVLSNTLSCLTCNTSVNKSRAKWRKKHFFPKIVFIHQHSSLEE